MTLENFYDAMAINYFAALHTILEVLPEMRQRRQGRIVNITSIGGKISVPHLLPYSASKFALVGLSEGLRSELAKDGIVVTTICPGLMRTGSPRNAEFKGQHRAEYAWFTISDSVPGFSIAPRRRHGKFSTLVDTDARKSCCRCRQNWEFCCTASLPASRPTSTAGSTACCRVRAASAGSPRSAGKVSRASPRPGSPP